MGNLKYSANKAEAIKKFKDSIVQSVNEKVIENTFIEPLLYMLCNKVGQAEPVMAIAEIPGPLLNSDSGKTILMQTVVPEILKHIDSDGMTPICISFTMEAWQWQKDIKDIENPNGISADDIKKNSKKEEVVIVSFETPNDCTGRVFKKRGTKQNENDEWIEGVYLEEVPYDQEPLLKGRFSGLFKKRKEQLN